MSTSYHAIVERQGPFWHIEVDGIEGATQGRHGYEEIDLMTQEFIAITTDQEGPFRVLYEFV